MADGTVVPGDPLAGFTPSAPVSTTDPGDPLAGWKPGTSVAPDTKPPASADTSSSGGVTTYLDKAWKRLAGGADATSKDLVPVDKPPPPATPVLDAVSAGYTSVPASITRPGERSFFTPETQRTLQTPGGPVPGREYWGPAVNLVGDTLGTALAGGAALGSGAAALTGKTLESLGVPRSAIRDLMLETTQAPVAPELRPPMATAPINASYREMMQPPPATLSELLQRQRAAPTTDPVTANLIATLKQAQGGADMPPAPTPFTPTQQPPLAAPTGGLLGVSAPPAGGLLRPGPTQAAATDILTQAQMEAQARAHFTPADQQAAQGAMIHPDASDAIRKPLMDAVPTDPEKAGIVGDTSLTRLGKNAQANQGQPMSFDTAMALDRQLTTAKRQAWANHDDTLASQIDEAQGQVRSKMESLGDNDTTGDASALAGLPSARKSWAQSVKQGQLEDINYRASLLPEGRQDAYVRSQSQALLRNDSKMRGWSDDERAALEDQVKSGNIGTIRALGLSMIKPAAQTVGGAAGGWLGGPIGGVVGSNVGGSLGETAAAALRARLSQMTLNPVMRQLSVNMPPPPASFRPPGQ